MSAHTRLGVTVAIVAACTLGACGGGSSSSSSGSTRKSGGTKESFCALEQRGTDEKGMTTSNGKFTDAQLVEIKQFYADLAAAAPTDQLRADIKYLGDGMVKLAQGDMSRYTNKAEVDKQKAAGARVKAYTSGTCKTTPRTAIHSP